MGKRELVLIALFVVVGAVVYQVTAPPLQPGQEGFSFGRVIQNMRRGIQGRHAQATAETRRTEAVSDDIKDLHFNVGSGDVTIVGEDRADAEFVLNASSNGYDEEDAKRLAKLVGLKVDRQAASLTVGIDYPRDGRQTGILVVHVPKRMGIRFEPKGGTLTISDVAVVSIKGNRGDTTVKNVAGEVNVGGRAGMLRIANAGSLRLSANNGNVEVSGVLGVASIDVTGAKLEVSSVVGPLDLKSRNSDIRLHDLPSLKAPLRLDLQAGEIVVDGLRTEARIDGRNTDIRVALDKIAPMTIYNTSENIVVTLPSAGGYTLDAIATDGAIVSDDAAVKVEGDEREHRARGQVRGGGPSVMLRATRGRIELRKAGGK
jgi:hypothetical protein